MPAAAAKPPEPRRKLGRLVLLIAPVVGFGAAVAALASVVDFRKAFGAVAHADPAWLGVAILLAILSTGLASLRLWLFLRAGEQPCGLRRCWSAVMAALALNAVLPSRGGDMVKAVFLCDQRRNLVPLLGIIVLERVVDVFVLASLVVIAALAERWLTAGLLGLAVMLMPVAAIILLRFLHRLPFTPRRLLRLSEGVQSALVHPRCFLAAIAVAALLWINVNLIVAALLCAVGAALPLGTVMAATPLAILVGILPLSISGIGTRDGVLVLLLGAYAPDERVLAAGLLYTVVGYWLLAALGVAALGFETIRKVNAAATARAAAPAASDECEARDRPSPR
jgi:uncharacterized membrane protein YbhN (UPF0104 family)